MLIAAAIMLLALALRLRGLDTTALWGDQAFTLNAAIELGGRDPAITHQLRAHFEAISGLLAERLAEAQRTGEIEATTPPDELAAYLLLGFYSLAVMVKILPDRAQLESAAAITLSVLDHT